MLGQRRRYIFDLWFDPSAAAAAAAAALIFQLSFYLFLVLWFFNGGTYDYNELLHPPEGYEQPQYYF